LNFGIGKYIFAVLDTNEVEQKIDK